MTGLPPELLDSIFSKLQRDGLANARLVSKIWSEHASPLLFRVVRVHGCSSSCQNFHNILVNKLDLVKEIQTHWVEPECPVEIENMLARINGQRMRSLSLIVESHNCSACQKRGSSQSELTLVSLILAAFCSKQISLNKLWLMKSNYGTSRSLEELGRCFPRQLASVVNLGLSSGGSTDNFESSLEYSADYFKNLHTLHLETDVFPKVATWPHVRVISLRVQRTDRIEEFLSRHPGLKRLSITLDFIPLLCDSWEYLMKAFLKNYLDHEDAERIARAAYSECKCFTKELESFLSYALRRVKTLKRGETDLFKTIEEDMDAKFTCFWNLWAEGAEGSLVKALSRSHVRFDINTIRLQSILGG